jgi:membrane-bound lytic murein transglycosylase F
MMLTLTTADELGVQSRLDPVQSIMGGARYLRRLHNRVPEDVQEPDRTWFALAAYNVGMGHLYDAMELAKRLDKNPYTWESLSEVFPLLTQKKYYKTLKHGYARGREPVSYVRHIRDYQNILLQKLNNN